MTDQELICACREKNAFAQKLLFERYWRKIFMVCIRYIQQQEAAEEILSDTFLKAFQNAEKFQYRGEGALQAWLSRIAVNECLMFLRKGNKMRFTGIQLNDLEGVEEPASEIIQKITGKELIGLIHTLPPGYKAVFNLHLMEGFSHKEIANMLNISESTSKSQLRKARLLLQQKIKDHGL
ncbi:MAG TPA: sigma-70 family RNA polymerase sigma factor [Edaphocola sp.]|nr:sigma-70 family RNA polymerase sigma factor [Edaphocola sp.]